MINERVFGELIFGFLVKYWTDLLLLALTNLFRVIYFANNDPLVVHYPTYYTYFVPKCSFKNYFIASTLLVQHL